MPQPIPGGVSRRHQPRDPVHRERRHEKYADAIYALYGRRCWLCGKKNADSIDHLVPVLWGGSDHPRNLKPAHGSCNSSKGAAVPRREWWSVPVMWIDGHGPNRPRGVRLPRPWYAGFVLTALMWLVAAGLWWFSQYAGGQGLRVVALFIFSFPLGYNISKWLLWRVACRGATARARVDRTPVDPEEWLEEARSNPPPLR